jgi:hypothetical protein
MDGLALNVFVENKIRIIPKAIIFFEDILVCCKVSPGYGE